MSIEMIPGLSVTASGLEAHKTRLEAIAQNVANANTTKGVDGKAYQRQLVSFEAELDRAGFNKVTVDAVLNDPRPGPMIHNPSHPHADDNGMVRMPNVNMATEMVDLISASRAYEANLSVAKTARSMAMKALEIGRG